MQFSPCMWPLEGVCRSCLCLRVGKGPLGPITWLGQQEAGVSCRAQVGDSVCTRVQNLLPWLPVTETQFGRWLLSFQSQEDSWTQSVRQLFYSVFFLLKDWANRSLQHLNLVKIKIRQKAHTVATIIRRLINSTNITYHDQL